MVWQFRTARKPAFPVSFLEACHKRAPAPVFTKQLVTDVERSLGLHFEHLDIGFLQSVSPQLPRGIAEVFEQGGRFGDFRRKRLDAVFQRQEKPRVGVAHETGQMLIHGLESPPRLVQEAHSASLLMGLSNLHQLDGRLPGEWRNHKSLVESGKRG